MSVDSSVHITDKTGKYKLLPKHQLVITRGLHNASEHAWARLFNTDSRQHVWIDSVHPKEYPQPRGRV